MTVYVLVLSRTDKNWNRKIGESKIWIAEISRTCSRNRFSGIRFREPLPKLNTRLQESVSRFYELVLDSRNRFVESRNRFLEPSIQFQDPKIFKSCGRKKLIMRQFWKGFFKKIGFDSQQYTYILKLSK